MERLDDAVKRREWVSRIQRFERCRSTVEEFCDQEQVSVSAFYQWRKKLAASHHGPIERAVSSPRDPGRPLAVVPKGFMPVKLLQSSGIEVRLANGVSLTLPAGDLEVLRQTLNILCRLPAEIASGKEDE